MKVFAIMVILVVLFSRPRVGSQKAHRPPCVSNLKQIHLALLQFAIDNDNKYPWDLLRKPDGLGDPRATNAYWTFLMVSNCLDSPKILTCPSDKATKPASDWKQFTQPEFRERALSYFLGLDAENRRPEAILSGDRNIGGTLPSSCARVGFDVQTLSPTNTFIRYTNAIHCVVGDILMADGSVQLVDTVGLQRLMHDQINDRALDTHIIFPR